jgi:hypothetical protein
MHFVRKVHLEFLIILRTNGGYFSKKYYSTDLCNGGAMCFLCGRNWIKYYLNELQASEILDLGNGS